MFDDELKKLCRKLKPILGKTADSLWLVYLMAETPELKRDAEILIQVLANRHLEATVDDQNIHLLPPSEAASSGEFFLGQVVYGGKERHPLYLRRENFIKHVGIFSITGGGKTNVAQILLLGLLARDMGRSHIIAYSVPRLRLALAVCWPAIPPSPLQPLRRPFQGHGRVLTPSHYPPRPAVPSRSVRAS